MDDEDPRIDELERENAELRARVAELEAMEQRALNIARNINSRNAEFETADYILRGET